MSTLEERLRILKMIEQGQVSAEAGAQLLDALGEPTRERLRPGAPARLLRMRVTNLQTRRQTINVTIPVNLVQVGLKLGARLGAHLAEVNVDEIVRAIETGASGRIFEMQDLDEGERIEITVE